MINIIFFTPFLLFMPVRIGTFYNFISKVPEFRIFTMRCHLWRIYWRVYIWFLMRMSFILMTAFQAIHLPLFQVSAICFPQILKMTSFIFFVFSFCFFVGFFLEIWIKDSALATFHSWCHLNQRLGRLQNLSLISESPFDQLPPVSDYICFQICRAVAAAASKP